MIAISGLISIFFYSISEIISRDYSNITLTPFLYLIFCYVLTALPLFSFERASSNILRINREQNKCIKLFALFIMCISIEPFVEIITQLPKVILNTNAIAKEYELRLEGRSVNFLSSIGSNLYLIMIRFQLVYPILLFYFCRNFTKNKLYVCGIFVPIISVWIRELIVGGRSLLVQNVLYVIVVYFIMRRFIPNTIQKVIVQYGRWVILLAISFVMIISIARFERVSTNFSSVWESLSLYSGESSLNFNSSLWYLEKQTNGVNTLSLPLNLLGISKVKSAEEFWEIGDNLGIRGNIFYTYVGSILMDYGKNGTIVFIICISLIGLFIINHNKYKGYSLSQIIILSLFSRILILPTFYTYTTYQSQLELITVIIFCIILSFIHPKKIIR